MFPAVTFSYKLCLAAIMYTLLIFRDAMEGGFFHEDLMGGLWSTGMLPFGYFCMFIGYPLYS